MTTPWGGVPPPLEHTAADVIAATRRRIGLEHPPPPPRMTPAEQADAEKAAKDQQSNCRFCIGIHQYANGPGCPRIASFELDPDGRVKSATYWPPDSGWAAGRVMLLEDAFETPEKGGEAEGDT